MQYLWEFCAILTLLHRFQEQARTEIYGSLYECQPLCHYNTVLPIQLQTEGCNVPSGFLTMWPCSYMKSNEQLGHGQVLQSSQQPRQVSICLPNTVADIPEDTGLKALWSDSPLSWHAICSMRISWQVFLSASIILRHTTALRSTVEELKPCSRRHLYSLERCTLLHCGCMYFLHHQQTASTCLYVFQYTVYVPFLVWLLSLPSLISLLLRHDARWA